MEVFECIKSRRAVRKFLRKDVPWEQISLILDAGRMAPTAGNLQNFKFVVVLDEDKKKAIAEACVKQFWIAEASVLIIIIGEPEKAKRFYGERGVNLYTIQNCATAAENMMLEATNLGLGSCWVGAFPEDAIRRILSVPDEYIPYVIIPVGYPDEVAPEPAKFPIENFTYFNGWRSKIRNAPAYMGYYSVDLQKNIKKGKKAVEEASKSAMEKAKEVFQNIKEKYKEKKKS